MPSTPPPRETTGDHPVVARPLTPTRATIVAGLVVFTFMALFEIAKDVFLPHLSKQESHVLTVIFTTALAASVASWLFRRQDALQELALREGRERARLDEIRRTLEERTAALERSSRALEVQVAERTRAEEELRVAQRRSAALINTLPDLLVVLDRDGTVVEAHVPPGSALLGERTTIRGRSVHDLLPVGVAHAAIERVRTCLDTGEPLVAEYELPQRDGRRHAEARFVRLDPGAALVLVRDVTEPRRLEEGLRQAQRMDSLGRLAGGVAHDFNNLLTAIIAHVDFAREAVEETAHVPPALAMSLGEDLQSVRHAATLAANLTRQLLSFARRQVLEPRVVSLTRLVRDLEHMLRRTTGATIEFDVRLDADDLPVLADPGQLEQVLVNLVVNARDAMPHGGRLSLTLVREDGPVPQARLEVRDTGVGMPDAVRVRIFEPFFTTKDAGRGAGLGLAICYGVVTRAGGSIVVDSEPGVGSTFTVRLPLTTALAVETPPVRPEARALSGRHVLLVEDEPAVRRLARRSLEHAGASVVEAADGAHALELLERGVRAPDVVVTDVVMPRVGGVELAERLRRSRAALPVVFTSGYLPDPIAAEDLQADGSRFVPKPFSPDDLVRAVAAVMTP